MSGRVMIHVQHLLGVGHLSRAAQLANALDQAGMDVALVSGGCPAPQIITRPGVRRMQLPSLRAADVSFSHLVDADGQPIDDKFRRDRCHRLLNLYEDIRPECLITELFPFGRRQLRFELLPLLEMALRDRHCRTIACSVRDIVNQRPHRQGEMLEWLNRYYRRVIVHGDADFIPFADSAPFLEHFRGQVLHTGYLTGAEPADARPDTERPEVLVSAGGGAVGAALFEAAACARSRTPLSHLGWRFRHARDEDPANLERWRDMAGPGAIFEPVAADFTTRLATARLAICQIGYNTAAELLATGTPAVLVPFAGGGETEQSRRAESFARLDYPVVSEGSLSMETLADAIEQGSTLPRRLHHGILLDDGRGASSGVLRGVAP